MKTRKELLEEIKKYREISFKDGLTQLYNNHKFKNDLKNAKYNKKRYNQNYLLIYCDLDNFKDYNDKYGHLEGNKILIKFAETIKRNIRKTDLAYRLGEGADEFVILIRHSYKKSAIKIIERIKKGKIKFSFGIGKTLKEAEKQMYKDKRRRLKK